MDKCKCGARRCYTEHRPGMAKAGFDCGTYISHQGAERYSRECLFTQLAAANEKLAESARLATESAQLADGLAKDLAAANERAGRLEAKLRSLCERLDEWWYEADPMGDVKKGERHPWTVAARKALEVPDADVS